MRKREEIIKEGQTQQIRDIVQTLQLEVLLDIRELLNKK